ncbi:HAD-IA family hydrolase [Kaarinaea lacus]
MVMRKSYELLIFDWDGTLINSEANIVSCMKAAMGDLQLPVLSDSEIKNIIGLGLKEALTTLYPDIDTNTANQLTDRYRYHFLTSEPSDPFQGVTETLNQLSDAQYFMAVATGKGRKGLDKALSTTGYSALFHTSRCADETRSKPHPQMLHEILDVLGVEPENALMVGDTEYDIDMANNAGMDSIAVTYGVHDRQRLVQCNPTTMIDAFDELLVWLDH